ncbi:glycoside hydrolase family 76 protein [Amycolatopsis jiangsuensis]|uniref:Putative alpha-1,6-mannanase (GH76 family) n=1 Tax=Amycolatopsis jiangsuensis TaxID=1181879 RepID=A0A840ITL4_9PSEU|nr:glycoside hydrolase family 76 protein [Amycolatopsis jiangsuensis]MBB4684498.1 putative alpha-1,6-mannanase (GH76 family) [Amycolatopsis jiangsuensis]
MPTSLVVVLVLASLAVPRAAADPVCAVFCDRLDPSQAAHESFPLPDKQINGRVLRLHASDPDGMAWASIDDGQPGDAVWLDRSWDGGATWDGLLGQAAVPDGRTGARTLMYNLTDPVAHRRGLLRACGDAQGVACTGWIHPQVCDAACDGTAPGTGDAQPVPATTIHGRDVSLHFDGQGMAWAALGAGGAGDEVWLDRSWDAGASWPDGSSLGRTSVPDGATGTHTAAFATRDLRGRMLGGAVRACGREVTHSDGSCTAWARPSRTRVAGAVDALMWSYEPTRAWWPSSWWNSAVAVTAVANSGSSEFDSVLARVFDVNRASFPAGERSSDPIEGDFISRAIDDSAWWGLAWIAAYDRTHEERYLTEAVTIAEYVHGFWDPGTCGGGVWWDRERTYKNAVTSGLYLRLTASLHLRVSGDTEWGQRARDAGDWYLGSGLINASGLVNDGLTAGCANNGQTVWTYNQGLAIGGFTELWRATGEQSYLDTARRLADAAEAGLTSGGILVESCDTGSNSCDDNQKQFKGILLRYFGDLAGATGEQSYQDFTRTQADAIWQHDRDPLNRIGQRWTGGSPNVTDWRTQASGLEALIAAG